MRSETRIVRVVFVDDDPGLCQLVELILNWEPDIELVGIATTGQQGVKMACDLAPDLLITDFRLPDISGVEVGNLVSQKCPTTRLLLISGYGRDYLRDELTMDLFTYVEKQAAFRDFPALIRKLAG